MKKLLLALAFLMFPLTAQAATYYMATNGVNAADQDGSSGEPWATFTYSFTRMTGGDTLIVGDGTYEEQLYNPPSGTAGAYTRVQAENNFAVTVVYSGFPLRITSGQYIRIEGFRFNGNKAASACTISASFIKVIRCAFYGAREPDDNTDVVDVTGGAHDVLFEECHAWGGGRYKFLAYQSSNIIFRRCVSRHDYVGYSTWSHQNSTFVRYQSANVSLQNCIAIDSGTGGSAGAVWNENHGGYEYTGQTSGEFQGCIILGSGWSGISDQRLKGTRNITNCSIINHGIGLIIGNWNGGLTGHTANFTIDHCTIMDTDGYGALDPVDGPGAGVTFEEYGGSLTASLKNSIITNASFYGVGQGYSGGDLNITRLILAGNYIDLESGTSGTNITYANPELQYFTRVESGTPGDGNATDGGDIGATILYYYGANETLWGEENYNTLTNVPLWPFPNEAQIQADMRTYNDHGVDGYRGFCANGQTLTKYIWEYLGNTIPDEIYGETPPDTILITTTSLADGALNSTYNVSVSADKVANWSLSSGTLPTNTSLINATSNQSCRISGYPNVTGDFSFTLRANSTANASITDTQAFTVNVAAVFDFPTTPILDNFTRGDQTPLGSGWIDLSGYAQMSVVSNQAGTLNETTETAAVYDTSYGPNAEVYATIANTNATEAVILALRYNPSTLSGYFLIMYPQGIIRIVRIDNDLGTTLANYTQAQSDGDSFGMRAVGPTLTAAYKASGGSWVSLGSVNDSIYSAAGNSFFSMYPSDIRIDDFGGGTYGSAPDVPIAILTTSLSHGVNGSYFNQSINSSSSGNWSLFSGSYPSNLTLVSAVETSQAYVQGYPNATGAFSFALQVTNATSNDTQSYSVNITASDTTPPAAVTNLAASTGSYAGAINLQWTAPGDDGNTGTASSYVIKYSTGLVSTNTSFTNAPSISNPPTPTAAGTTQTVTVSGLANSTRYYFALKAWDNEGQASGISNMANATSGDTPPAATPGPYGWRLN